LSLPIGPIGRIVRCMCVLWSCRTVNQWWATLKRRQAIFCHTADTAISRKV